MGNSKGKTNSLLDAIFQQSISLLLGVFITGILVWSCSYLAVTYQNEQNDISEQLLEIQMQTAEVKVENEMSTVFVNGWFSNLEDALQKQALYLTYLESYKTNPQLDSNLISNVLDWHDKAINELYIELGKVSGYKISRDIGVANQRSLIELYTLEINILQNIRELTASWDKLTIEEREQKLKNIDGQNQQISSLAAQMTSLGGQSVAQTQLEWQQVENKFIDLQNRHDQIQLKRNAAVIGVILGFALLIFLIWYGVKSQSKKDAVQKKEKGAAPKKQNKKK